MYNVELFDMSRPHKLRDERIDRKATYHYDVVHSKVYCQIVSKLRGGFVLLHTEVSAYIAVPKA
jgi:hypothetical protein